MAAMTDAMTRGRRMVGDVSMAGELVRFGEMRKVATVKNQPVFFLKKEAKTFCS